MLYPNKPFLKSLLVFTLFLLPITQSPATDLPQQVNQLHTQIMEANAKIAILALDQQKTVITISTLQTGLNMAHREISALKNEHNQLVATNTEIHRTANGHGRGGR